MFPAFCDSDLLIRFFVSSPRFQGEAFVDRLRSWDRLDSGSIGYSSSRIAGTLFSRYKFNSGLKLKFRPNTRAYSLNSLRNISSAFGSPYKKVYREKFIGISIREISNIVNKILVFKGIDLKIKI